MSHNKIARSSWYKIYDRILSIHSAGMGEKKKIFPNTEKGFIQLCVHCKQTLTDVNPVPYVCALEENLRLSF